MAKNWLKKTKSKSEEPMTDIAVKTQKKRKKISGREWQWIQMSIFPVLHVFLFSYVTLYGIIIAFKDYKYAKGIWGSEWVGLDNFEFFLKSQDFPRLIKNTIGLNGLFIITLMIAEVALAIVFFELTSRRALKVYQTILITPNFISWVVVGYVVYALLQPQHGVINNILGQFGIEPISFYTTPEPWPFILTVANIWKKVGMGCIIYYATMMGIDVTLYEAARIDGATKWQEIKYITIPMLMRVVMLRLIMYVGGILNSDFGLFYQLTRDSGPLYAKIDVFDTYINRAFRVIGDFELSTSVGLFKNIVGFILVYITNAIVRKYDDELSLF